MGKIEDLISATEKEVSEAKEAEDTEREQAAQARLDSLKEAKSEYDSVKGGARTEGRDSGVQKERERIAKARGVSVDDLDAKLEADAKAAAESQSEAERLKAESKAHEESLTVEKQAREAAEKREKGLIIQQALSEEFTKQGVISDRRGGAFAQVNRSDLEVQDDGSVKGAEDAVKKLAESASYLFEEEKEPAKPAGSRPTPRPAGGKKEDKERDEEARRRHQASARANF